LPRGVAEGELAVKADRWRGIVRSRLSRAIRSLVWGYPRPCPVLPEALARATQALFYSIPWCPGLPYALSGATLGFVRGYPKTYFLISLGVRGYPYGLSGATQSLVRGYPELCPGLPKALFINFLGCPGLPLWPVRGYPVSRGTPISHI